MTASEKAAQQQRTEQFRLLHTSTKLLVLPNAWDAGSAIIFEKAGFGAIGTSSAGIAYSRGYPDGEHIAFQDVLECSQRILKRITVPLSVDIETGYSTNTATIVANVQQIIELGAVGINIEDATTQTSLSDLSVQTERIRAIASLKQDLGIPFVLNARTDVYWLGIGKAQNRLELALERALEYAEAGADCIFIPGHLERESIATLASEIPVALNIIATPNGLSVAELESLGVARLSLGSGPIRASLGLTQQIANELKHNDFSSMYQKALSYKNSNDLFS